MLALASLCTCMNYADRINISVAIIPLAEAYNLSVRQQAAVMSVFFVGYIPMQLFVAVLCRRFRAHAVLAVDALLWSVFTIATPLSARLGFPALLFCRILMGMSESVAFPAVYHFLSAWMPSTERGITVAMLDGGLHFGVVIALVLSPCIIVTLGWEFVFYIFGEAGFVWLLFWLSLAYNRESAPVHDSFAIVRGTAEEDASHLHTRSKKGQQSLPSKDDECQTNLENVLPGSSEGETNRICVRTTKLSPFTKEERALIITAMTDKSTLSVIVTQLLFNLVTYTILAWLPTYLYQEFKVPTKSLFVACIPFFVKTVAGMFAGSLADRMVAAGMSLTTVRTLITYASGGGTAVCIILFSRARNVHEAILSVSMVLAFMSGASGGFSAGLLDLTDSGTAGIFTSVSNMFSSTAGLFSAPLAAEIRAFSGNSWRVAFASLAVWVLLAMVLFGFFFRGEEKVLVSRESERSETDGELH